MAPGPETSPGGFLKVAGACAALLVFAVLVGTVPRVAGARDAAGLHFQEERVVFRDVQAGDLVEYVFRYRNESERPIRILRVKPT